MDLDFTLVDGLRPLPRYFLEGQAIGEQFLYCYRAILFRCKHPVQKLPYQAYQIILKRQTITYKTRHLIQGELHPKLKLSVFYGLPLNYKHVLKNNTCLSMLD